MKTLLTVLFVAMFVAASYAQAPATNPIPVPTAASGAVTGSAFVVRTGAPAFFSAPNFSRAVRTNATNVVAPAQIPTVTVAPTVPAPAPAGTPVVPAQATPIVPPQGPLAIPGQPTPGVAAGTTAGAIGPGGAAVINPAGTNRVLPLTNEILAGAIRFQEADLLAVLDYYADLVGRTILRSPQVPPNVKINLHNKTPLSRQEGIDALNTILALNNVTMVEEGEKFIKAVPATTVFQEAVKFSRDPGDNLPESQKIVAQIVHLKNVTPEDVTQLLTFFSKLQNSVLALKGTQILILRDYAENVKRMLEILEELDVAQPLEIEPVVIPIKYALAGDVASVLSGLSAGGSTVSFGAGSGAGGFGGGGGGVGGFGGGGGGFGQQNRLGGGGGFGGQNYPGQAGGLNQGLGGTRSLGSTGLGGGGGGFGGRSAFGNRLGQAVQRSVGAAGGGAAGGASGDIQLIGMAKIIADERSNALLIFADRRDLPMITNIISKLDVVLPQVLIEALIMEVNLGRDKQVGVSMVQTRQDFGNWTTAGGALNGPGITDPKSIAGINSVATNVFDPGGFTYLGRLGDEFAVVMRAVENDSRINVLSRPRVQTSNAKTANIFVGEQRPFITGSYFNDFGGGGSRSQYQLQDIGISLSVTPIINQEGLVTMEIAQDISQVGGTTKIDNNDVPITITRTAQSYVSVHDRDTIILGGFISTTKSKSTGGIPYLKDIPGLGVLFRSSSESVQRVELMVLIRPTVLPTPEAAALTAATEREKLPGIKRAERDEEEFASKQLEKERLAEEKHERGKR